MDNNYMLSTIDNPFNPFHDFDSWLMYDIEQGWNTCGILGRIVNLREDMTQKEADDEISRAINAIVDNDITGIFIRKYPDDANTPES